jgi:energy-coupling factor transport system ATP-binding protein
MSLAISVERLTFRYPNGQEALRDVTIGIETGRIVALIGKNGAGKTTLARHLNSLLKPTSGTVVVQGIDASKRSASEMAREVGYVFQNPEDQLFGSSVFEEVAFGPKNLGMGEERIKRQVEASLSMVGLLSFASEHPYNMPYGQRKMLCLASVLAMDTSIVIMDEPNAGQDYQGLCLLGSILAQLKRIGKTVLIISHDMEFVAEHCEKVVLMCDGRIIAYDSAKRILSDRSKLELSGARPPQVTRLAHGLSPNGIRSDIVTVEEMVEALVERSRKAG